MKTEYVDNLHELKNIFQSNNIIKLYQKHIEFFKLIKLTLQKELKEFSFCSSVVENGMDYSYFHFSNERLKKLGLKFVFVYDYQSLDYQIWLSGVNRSVQKRYTSLFLTKDVEFQLTSNPMLTDYILKCPIELTYNADEQLVSSIIKHVIKFTSLIDKYVNT